MSDLGPTDILEGRLYLGDYGDANFRNQKMIRETLDASSLSETMSAEDLASGIEALERYALERVSVLVYCRTGTRSLAIVIGYLMKIKQWTLAHTYQYVKYLRPSAQLDTKTEECLASYESAMMDAADRDSDFPSSRDFIRVKPNSDASSVYVHLTDLPRSTAAAPSAYSNPNEANEDDGPSNDNMTIPKNADSDFPSSGEFVRVKPNSDASSQYVHRTDLPRPTAAAPSAYSNPNEDDGPSNHNMTIPKNADNDFPSSGEFVRVKPNSDASSQYVHLTTDLPRPTAAAAPSAYSNPNEDVGPPNDNTNVPTNAQVPESIFSGGSSNTPGRSPLNELTGAAAGAGQPSTPDSSTCSTTNQANP